MNLPTALLIGLCVFVSIIVWACCAHSGKIDEQQSEYPVDPCDDPEYQKMVDELALQCRCSHDRPCDGLLAGGLCDNLQWTNDRDEEDDL